VRGKGTGASTNPAATPPWQLQRIAEGLAAAREGQTLPVDEVLRAIALKHGWTR